MPFDPVAYCHGHNISKSLFSYRFVNAAVGSYYQSIQIFTARCTYCKAQYCYRKLSVRRSVCLSVCLSVTLMYRGRIRWTGSKLIIRIISLGSSLLGAITRQSSPRGTSQKFGWNRGGIALLSRKPAISVKRGKMGPRLLLVANRKSYTRFRLVPKSTTLDDPERPVPYFTVTCSLKPTTKIGIKIKPHCQRRRCSPVTLVSGNISLYGYSPGSLERGCQTSVG